MTWFILNVLLLIMSSVSLHEVVSEFKNPSNNGVFIGRHFLFQGILLGLICLFGMVMSELSVFRYNSMSTTFLMIISTISLIITIVCSYVFFKKMKNPPYNNMLFQYVLFIMVGLYTIVLSVLKMLGVILGTN
jgi:uncharacterized membrane protein